MWKSTVTLSLVLAVMPQLSSSVEESSSDSLEDIVYTTTASSSMSRKRTTTSLVSTFSQPDSATVGPELLLSTNSHLTQSPSQSETTSVDPHQVSTSNRSSTSLPETTSSSADESSLTSSTDPSSFVTDSLETSNIYSRVLTHAPKETFSENADIVAPTLNVSGWSTRVSGDKAIPDNPEDEDVDGNGKDSHPKEIAIVFVCVLLVVYGCLLAWLARMMCHIETKLKLRGKVNKNLSEPLLELQEPENSNEAVEVIEVNEVQTDDNEIQGELKELDETNQEPDDVRWSQVGMEGHGQEIEMMETEETRPDFKGLVGDFAVVARLQEYMVIDMMDEDIQTQK